MPEESSSYDESDVLDQNPTPRLILDSRIRTFPDRLRELIGSQSSRAFARKCGLSEAAVRDYLRGASFPTLDRAAALAAAGGKTLEWLAVGEQAQPGSISGESLGGDYALIPLYNVKFGGGRGRAVFDAEQIVARMAFSRYWLKKQGLNESDLVYAHLDGDSMKGVVADGSIMLIDRSKQRLSHGVVMALAIEDADSVELLVKRIERLPDGSARLLSANQMYEPVLVQTADLPALKVVGRVWWAGSLVV